MFVHGREEYEKALVTTEKLFSDQNTSIETLSVEDLEQMNGVVKSDYAADKVNAGIDIITFLTETTIFPSKGEARKMIQGGGVSVNRKKIDDLKFTVDSSLLLHKKYLLVQKGKKNYYLVKVV